MFFYFRKNLKRCINIPAEVGNGLRIVGASAADGLAVEFHFAFIRVAICGNAALAHDGFSDDEKGFFGFGIGFPERFADSVVVVGVDGGDAPAPGFVFFCGVFARHGFGHGGKLYVV